LTLYFPRKTNCPQSRPDPNLAPDRMARIVDIILNYAD
jgi:hypothetical protein